MCARLNSRWGLVNVHDASFKGCVAAMKRGVEDESAARPLSVFVRR